MCLIQLAPQQPSAPQEVERLGHMLEVIPGVRSEMVKGQEHMRVPIEEQQQVQIGGVTQNPRLQKFLD